MNFLTLIKLATNIFFDFPLNFLNFKILYAPQLEQTVHILTLI